MSTPLASGGPLELDEERMLPLRPWRAAAEDPQRPSFARFVDDAWQDVTASDHLATVLATARGLVASGVQAGDRVAVMSETRYEWLVLDEAIWASGAATVPIYPSSSTGQAEWIISNSGSRLVVVEHEEQAAEIAGLDLGVELLVLDSGAVAELARRGGEVAESEIERRRDALTLDDIASLVYTSGTTGRPKGVIITHRQLLAEVAGVLQHPVGVVGQPGRRVLMFLPMAHVLARAVTHAAAQGGATVGFWADFGTISEKFVSFRPHMVLGVPRVFEKVHAGIRSSAAKGGRVPSEIFRRGERVAIEWSRAKGEDGRGETSGPGPRLRLEHAVFDRLLFRRVRAALGGECGYAISGGGALGEQLGHFFRGVGVPIQEGYGLTETCAAITVNGPGCQRIGTVGRPLAGNRVRIADSGEIEVAGAVVAQRYWNDPEATEKSFGGGWFATGDLGGLDEDGYLTISGRAKEIIVTAGGKNVIPGPLEDNLRGDPLVANAMVVGEGRPFVAALVALDEDALTRWAQEQGLTGPPEELLGSDALHERIQQRVDEGNTLVSRAEGVRSFELVLEDFTEEREELTATMKLRRHVIEKTRSEQIERIYSRRR